MEPQTIGHVQEQLDSAFSTMRGNMQMMAERDSQLHSMAEKTNEFSSSAARFSQGAMQLRRQEEMRRRRMILLAVALAMALAWAAVAYRLRGEPYFRKFLQASAAAAAALVLVASAVLRCCCGHEEPDGSQPAE
mmetsp:Transcript_19524/g.55010  ORF Transcript_19524/g.55010 Transcript_19524/m.55010 type:complete len:134 (-) Transcript_19524:109-510(-)